MRAHTNALACLGLRHVPELPRFTAALFAALFAAVGCAPLSAPLERHGPVPPPSDGDAFAVALFQTTGARLESGHRWRLEDNGRVFDAVIDDIAHAHTSVDIVSYIWHSGEPSDRILAALGRRARGAVSSCAAARTRRGSRRASQ